MSEQDQALAEKPRQIIDKKYDGRSSFTVEETGEIFGVSRPTAYARAGDGSWPTVRVSPRVLRIPRWWVEQRLAGC